MKNIFVSSNGETKLVELDDKSISMLDLNGIDYFEADGVGITAYKLLQKFSTTGNVKTKQLYKSLNLNIKY